MRANHWYFIFSPEVGLWRAVKKKKKKKRKKQKKKWILKMM